MADRGWGMVEENKEYSPQNAEDAEKIKNEDEEVIRR